MSLEECNTVPENIYIGALALPTWQLPRTPSLKGPLLYELSSHSAGAS
jgi:hypothetical protein